MLDEFLDEFLDERLLTAEQLICDFGLKKIVDGDVIITYACSYVVSKLLVSAKEAGKNFRVILVYSNPMREGKGELIKKKKKSQIVIIEFLNRLTQAGIDCTYVLLNGVCYMMKESTKVFLGAYALLSNGNLVSRVGSALVAMTAHEYNVPVIVCSEV
jgi:translation initiation factor eIF-2B subunit delta